MPSAPHLAQLDLRYATPDSVGEFVEATVHGFHEDYTEDLWIPGRAVIEPERFFGYAVDGRWISTCGAYSRVLTVPGGTVPAAAVTFVTVQPSYRRRGLLRRMMEHQLADVVARGTEPVALLWASESLIYGRFGYGHAVPRHGLSGRTRSTGFLPSVRVGEGSVGELRREDAIAVIKQLHAAMLPERPGSLDRPDPWWEVKWHDPEPWRKGLPALRFAVHYDAGGGPDGYAAFRVKDVGGNTEAEVIILDLDATEPAAYAALWRFLLDLDLVQTFDRHDAPVDDPLRYLALDGRQVQTKLDDSLYARLVDVPAALRARAYSADIDVVIGVEDTLLPDNGGAVRLQAGPDGVSVSPSPRTPDFSLNVRELGSIYLGGVSLNALHGAGLVAERTRGSVRAAAAAFAWHRAPFCPDYF